MQPGYEQTERLEGIPPIDGLDYWLLEPTQSADDPLSDAYVMGVDETGESRILAFLDGAQGMAYRCDAPVDGTVQNPRDAGAEPLVKIVGDIDGDTGQLVIKQPEGHWRRYSRWDRLAKPPATQPDAVVRTLPQCGCGGYLGAPMMFSSFKEMLAYFFVVFSDAQSVNAKHAAILGGESCAL